MRILRAHTTRWAGASTQAEHEGERLSPDWRGTLQEDSYYNQPQDRV